MFKGRQVVSINSLWSLLNPVLAAASLVRRPQGLESEGYQCVGVYDNDELVGIYGLLKLTRYRPDKYVESGNMVIHPRPLFSDA